MKFNLIETHAKISFQEWQETQEYSSLLLSPTSRDFKKDTDKTFKLSPEIKIQGAENIPQTGPVIVAFSHAEWWKDPNIGPGWEKFKMIQEIQKVRNNKQVNLMAYINYFRETGSKKMRPIRAAIVNRVVKQVEKAYGVKVTDVDPANPAKIMEVIDQANSALREGVPLLISPEGLPTLEPLKPKRGIAMIARTSRAPVIGVAFREDRLPSGKFEHSVVFTPPRTYDAATLTQKGIKGKEQEFAELIMRDIANQLPVTQRGRYQ